MTLCLWKERQYRGQLKAHFDNGRPIKLSNDLFEEVRLQYFEEFKFTKFYIIAN